LLHTLRRKIRQKGLDFAIQFTIITVVDKL